MNIMRWYQPNKSIQFAPEFIPKVSANEVKDLIEAGYSRTGDAEKIGKKYKLTLDKQLSNINQKVYYDKERNPTVVFKGTKSKDDVITDVLLGAGLENYSTRFRDSKKLIEDVKKKYHNKPILTTGHSLGGSLAEYSGGDKIITVNKGVGFGGIGKEISNKQTDIRTNNDIVSLLSNTQHGSKKINIKTNHTSPLSEHSHKNLSKLNNKIL
jgi:hypothetical protein